MNATGMFLNVLLVGLKNRIWKVLGNGIYGHIFCQLSCAAICVLKLVLCIRMDECVFNEDDDVPLRSQVEQRVLVPRRFEVGEGGG